MLSSILVPKNEYVIKSGELASGMYFIMKGEVRVISSDGVTTLKTLGKYQHFGEMDLVQDN